MFISALIVWLNRWPSQSVVSDPRIDWGESVAISDGYNVLWPKKKSDTGHNDGKTKITSLKQEENENN